MRGNLAQILQKIGRDVALPGVDLAIELLQELRADLSGGVNYVEGEVVEAAPKRLGRPGKKKRGSWGNMTAEERSTEMSRRMMVARAKRGEKVKGLGHPRNPDHPGHDAWVEKMKAANQKAWGGLTPKKRKERIAAALAGRSARHAVEEIKAAS